MKARVIDTVANVEARAVGVQPLPVGVYYVDQTYGLLLDWVQESPAKAAEISQAVYVCELGDDGEFKEKKKAPKDLVRRHDFSGWPKQDEVIPDE